MTWLENLTSQGTTPAKLNQRERDMGRRREGVDLDKLHGVGVRI